MTGFQLCYNGFTIGCFIGVNALVQVADHKFQADADDSMIIGYEYATGTFVGL